MDEKKREDMLHRCAVCGRVAAVLSILLLVPMIRKLRAKPHAKKHGFPIFGH